MKQLVFDIVSRQCIGWVEGIWDGEGIAVPVDTVPDDVGSLYLDDHGSMVADPTILISRAKAARIADIKRQATANIEALAWRIERAQERDRLGLAGETVEDVLLEREAIRRASNRCEDEINAAQDVDAVRSVQFSVTDADRASSLRLTRYQFIGRFTRAEMEGIASAADQNAAIKVLLLKWQTADGIVLNDPAAMAGVQALEIAGLIGEGRAAEILS